MAKGKKGKELKRKRHATALAEEIEDEAMARAAEVRALGREVDGAMDESLFFEDKMPMAKGKVKEKILKEEKKREKGKTGKVLHYETVIMPNENVRAIPTGKVRKMSGLKDGVSPADKRRVEMSVENEQFLSRRKKRGAVAKPGSYDVWDVQDVAVTDGNWWKAPVKKKKRTPAASVEAAPMPEKDIDAGMSINPAFPDHQNLLGEAVARVLDEEHGKDLVAEQLQGDGDEMEETAELAEAPEEPINEAEKDVVKLDALKEVGKKTKTQRNREARRKQAELEARERGSRKRLFQDIENLGEIIAELDRQKIPDSDKVARKIQRRLKKRVGGREVPKKEIDVAFTEELSLHMREMRVKGSLLKDKYVSLQRRGFVVPKSKKKRAKF